MGMHIKAKIYITRKARLAAALLLLAGACTDNETFAPVPVTDYGDEPVMIRAVTAGHGNATRSGNIQSGEEAICNRKLLFTYPSASDGGKMKSVECQFNDAGIGYIYKDEARQEPLRWKDIYTGQEHYPGNALDAVYLDNLVNYPVQEAVRDPQKPGIYLVSDNFTKMRFGKEGEWVPQSVDFYNNQYKRMIAPVGSPKAEEVDIIWGSISKPSPGKALEFELEHKMSAISFRFHSDDKKIQESLEGTNIKVWLDEVRVWLEDTRNENDTVLTPFNRSKGQMYSGRNFGNYNFQNGVYLVNDSTLEPPGKETMSTPYYSTPVWIFPPHNFPPSYNKWPKLTIDLGDEKIYHGSLPKIMDYWKLDNKGVWTLLENQPMNFMSNYHLVFKVKLTDNIGQRELLFEGVLVETWTSGFREDASLSESGIYDWEDLVTLAEIYKENPEADNYRLMKYGNWDESGGRWKFVLWRNIKMPEGTPLPAFGDNRFDIDFQMYTIKIGNTAIWKEDLGRPSSVNS